MRLTYGGKYGPSVSGTVRIGHRRRCPSVRMEPGTCLNDGTELEAWTVGRGTMIGRNTIIRGVSSIGRFTTIGDGCRIGAVLPSFDSVSTSPVFRRDGVPWYPGSPVVPSVFRTQSAGRTEIGSDVWIGSDVVIQAGVCIGDGAVILPGSVICRDIEPFSVADPAQPDRRIERMPAEYAEKLKNIAWWEYGDSLFYDLPADMESFDEVLEYLFRRTQHCKKIPRCAEAFQFSWDGSGWTVAFEEEGRKELMYRFPTG